MREEIEGNTMSLWHSGIKDPFLRYYVRSMSKIDKNTREELCGFVDGCSGKADDGFRGSDGTSLSICASDGICVVVQRMLLFVVAAEQKAELEGLFVDDLAYLAVACNDFDRYALFQDNRWVVCVCVCVCVCDNTYLLKHPYSARYFITKHGQQLLSKWATLHPLATPSKFDLLSSIQRVVEVRAIRGAGKRKEESSK